MICTPMIKFLAVNIKKEEEEEKEMIIKEDI